MADGSVARVLVVEDVALTTEQLCELIATLPYPIECRTAGTEREALAAIDEAIPEFVILDLRLKEGSGFNVLKALRNNEAKPTIIVTTNYAFPEYREYALLVGADYFVDKALELASIPAILESRIGKKVGRRLQ